MGKRPANPSHDESKMIVGGESTGLMLDDLLRQDGTYKLVPNNYHPAPACTSRAGAAPLRDQYPELIEIPPWMWGVAEKLGEWKQHDHEAGSDAHWPGDEHNMGNVAELMARAMCYKALGDQDFGWAPVYNQRYYRLKGGRIPKPSIRASEDEGGNPDWDLRIGSPDNFWRMEVKATGWGLPEQWVLRVKASEYNPHPRLYVLCTMIVDPYIAQGHYPKYMLPFHWIKSPVIDQTYITAQLQINMNGETVKHPLAWTAPCRLFPFPGFSRKLADEPYRPHPYSGRGGAYIGQEVQPVNMEMLRQLADSANQ